MRAVLVFLTLFSAAEAIAAEAKVPAKPVQPADLILFRATFDGEADAVLLGKTASAQKALNVKYEPSDRSKALVLGKGTHLQYLLAGGTPPEGGALEFRFRPNFPQTSEQPKRMVFAMKGKGGSAITLEYLPIGKRWMLTAKTRKRTRMLPVWHGAAKEAKWNHFLFVWNKESKRSGTFVLYHQGKWAASGDYDFRWYGVTSLAIGGAHDSQISIDEMVIYKRPFTRDQAAFLATSFAEKGDRLAALCERITVDEQVLAARRALVAQLKGKVGRLIHHRSIKRKDYKFPEGIIATGIHPDDVGKMDLSRFKVIYFPEGPRYQLTPEQRKVFVDYVKNGGGYVGSCQGAMFAGQNKILDFKFYNFWVWGILKVTLRPHIITDGRKATIAMHFGNGPLMIPGKGCTTLGTYVTGWPQKPIPSAIITGTCGKGRVVVFGGHPLGGQVKYRRKGFYYTGKFLETDRMLVNALLYAAKITENKQGAK